MIRLAWYNTRVSQEEEAPLDSIISKAQELLESFDQAELEKKKQELTKQYRQLNPAKLKRHIEEKQNQLWKLVQTKQQEQTQQAKMKHENKSENTKNSQHLTHVSVAHLIAEPTPFRLHG